MDSDKLLEAVNLAIAACEDGKNRGHHTLQQQCRWLDDLRKKLITLRDQATADTETPDRQS